MNLILSRACSNSCPYCFESAERQDGKQGLISMENVGLFAKWVRSARLGYLSLLGGEPFLHPKLPAIVKLFRENCPGTALRILTGGVFNKDLLDTISPDDVTLVFNVNEPRDYRNPKHSGKVINNIELAIKKGFKVTLGFNVWRLDFDHSFIPHLADRLGMVGFTWTVANPIRGCASKVVQPDDFASLAERCMDMLQEASGLNLQAVLDCPVPLCFFKDNDLAWIRQYHPDTASGMGVCKPVLDVTPELEVLRCFALSKLIRLKVLDFRDEDEIEKWFLKHLDTQLLNGGYRSYCNECSHFEMGRCYGGCLAWHEGGITTEKSPKDIFSELELAMHMAIENGEPSRALELYETANFWSKTDMAAFAAAVAASRLEDWQKALRYAIDANTRAENPDFMRKVGEFIRGMPASVDFVKSAAAAGEDSVRFVFDTRPNNDDEAVDT